MLKILKIFFGAKGTRPVAVLLCLLLAGLAEGVGLASLLPVMSIALGRPDEEPGAAAVILTDALGRVGVPAELFPLVSVAVGAIILKNALNLAAMTYVGYAVAHVATSLRRDLVESLMNVRWSYFTQQPLGRIANALSVDATRAGNAYIAAARFLVFGIQSAIYAGVALFVSWKVALVALAVGLLIAAFLSSLVRAAKRAGRRQTHHTADFITYLTDALNNIKPLKAMELQNSFAGLLDRNIVRLRRALRHQVMAKEALKNLTESLAAVALGFALVFAVTLIDVPPAELVVMAVLLIQLVNAIARIQREYQSAAIFESAFYNVRNLISASDAERELDTGSAVPRFERGARLVDVSFSHPRTPVLHEVSLEIPRGTITVLTGPSGSGKTTVTDLLLGFRVPDSGQVLLDERPLGEYSLRAWRRMIGYVPQELVLFHDSVLANVALGDPEIGEARVRAALAAAGALDFVEQMPEGLHSQVGEKGAKVSGGQRQRIALARALVKRPRMLILDEVTSALDPESEAAIVENIRALASETTILAITHRPAFLEIADRVYRLVDGRVVAPETGDALLGRAR